MARTRVEVWGVEPYDPGKHGNHPPRAQQLNPSPLMAVDGKLSSDEARNNVVESLSEMGYRVRSVNASPEGKLIAYVVVLPPGIEPKKRKERPSGVKPEIAGG